MDILIDCFAVLHQRQVGRHCFVRCCHMSRGSLMNKEYAVGTFFDIEGVFNNVRSEAVIKFLEKFW